MRGASVYVAPALAFFAGFASAGFESFFVSFAVESLPGAALASPPESPLTLSPDLSPALAPGFGPAYRSEYQPPPLSVKLVWLMSFSTFFALHLGQVRTGLSTSSAILRTGGRTRRRRTRRWASGVLSHLRSPELKHRRGAVKRRQRVLVSTC